jgi:alpha-galactosidase
MPQPYGDLEIWSKEMQNGSRAVALLNRGSATQTITVNWERIGYPGHLSAGVRDLWARKDLGRFDGKFSARVQSHEVVMLRVTP